MYWITPFSEGAPASELKQSASFLRRATGGGDDKVKTKGPKATTTSNSSNAIKKLPPPKSKVLEEVQDMMMQSFDDPADDFSNLRKLISEVSVQMYTVENKCIFNKRTIKVGLSSS